VVKAAGIGRAIMCERNRVGSTRLRGNRHKTRVTMNMDRNANAAPAGGPRPFGGSFFGLGSGPASNDAMAGILAQNWWVVALRGVFAILFGLCAIFLPGATLAALVLLFAAYMLVDGIFAIAAGIRATRRGERWGLLILEGIADLIAAAIAFFWPLATIVAFVFLMGAWAIVTGVLLTSAAFRLNLAHGRWLMALGGIVSVLWGFLLLLSPIAGAIVLTWWMGGYALFFGGVLLALAFRLRRLRHELPPPGALSPGYS
jgi:uncharacterized membrane protein HdeD (DUF308 family)